LNPDLRRIDRMPRTPVDGKKVIEYRVTLGGKERQLLDEITTAYQVKNIGGTIGNILGNPAIIGLISLAVIAWVNSKLDPDWEEIIQDMTPDQLKDWLETQNLVGSGIGALIGGILAGPFGAIGGAVVGGVAVEGGEAALDAIGQELDERLEPSTTMFIVLQILKLRDRIPFI
jgi:hypothetical protein